MAEFFGDKLRWLRTQLRMTQSDLAQQLGVATQAHVSYLEARQSAPSLFLVVRVAELFGVTTDYLLQDTIPTHDFNSYQTGSQPRQLGTSFFGENLRRLRRQHGMTQVQLAEHLDHLSQAAISAFELGDKTPSITIVLRCADLFGVRTDDLLVDAAE